MPKINSPCQLIASLVTLFALLLKSHAGDIATDWGRGEEEGTLRETCATGKFKYVNFQYLTDFGNGQTPSLLIGPHRNPEVEKDQNLTDSINYCQSQGIKILLSIGGPWDDYNLTSEQDARDVANYLWNNYLGGHTNFRPLGNDELDGIDFDIQNSGTNHYDTLARKLKEYKGSKKFHLSASTQCPFPHKHLRGALKTGLFDYVWIQFGYNPQCGYNSTNPDPFKKSWSKWTQSINAGKFFVGLPVWSSDSGYILTNTLINEVLPYIKRSRKYGGIILYSRHGDELTGYSDEGKGSVLSFFLPVYVTLTI